MTQRHKRFFWIVYATLCALDLVAGLDNLIFQPATPGVIVGLICLAMVTWMVAYPLIARMRLK